MKQTTSDIPMLPRDGAIRRGMSEVAQVRRRETVPFPLPPDTGVVVCHYDNIALAASGITRPRLPTFSSDESEAATTELETAVSAATDTQLMN